MNGAVGLTGNDGTGGSFLRLSGLGIEPSNETFAGPNLHRIAVSESFGPCYLGPCDGLVVVDANKRPQAGEMPVVVDGVCSIFCHALTNWLGGVGLIHCAYVGGCSSLLSQRIAFSVFRGSGRSQSKHWKVRPPLPSGGSAKVRLAPHLGQVSRSPSPMRIILPPKW